MHKLGKPFLIYIAGLFIASSCSRSAPPVKDEGLKEFSLIVLGTVQDAGSPHIGCKKDCCRNLFTHPDTSRKVTCLGLVDPVTHKTFMFEASPDISTQAKMLKRFAGDSAAELPDYIFLTHAHIGHYAGLMYLGREAINAKQVPVFAMPRMKEYLETNGPWSQLVELHNIHLQALEDDVFMKLGDSIQVKAITVPHRDEYSETVGYYIFGPRKTALFIPDIDKWSKWDRSVVLSVGTVDYAFIDATFYDGAEIGHRDISEIPHPFVIETMKLFESEPASVRDKIYFIHMNHTNPMLSPDSPESKKVETAGYHIARLGMAFTL